MTLGETVLSKLAEWRPADSGRHQFRYVDARSGWTISLAVEKTDELSCQLHEVVCERATNLATDLKSWSNSLAKRMTGLMEPLKVIEIDEHRGEAILRSDEPTTRGDRKAHFEVRLLGTRRATLVRFAAEVEPTARRQQISFTLTRESIGKLVDDVAGV
jgi:hypothetical protein